MDTLSLRLNSRWKHTALSVLFFMLLMHGYRYFQMDFSHDALAFAAKQDMAWKISLGRYLQPVYWLLRGKIAAPFVVGVFSYIWLVPAVYLMGKLLGVTSRTGIFLISGVVVGNVSMVSANASYIHDADIFVLAMLLNTLAMYLCTREHRLCLAGAVVCIAAGAALYQAYTQVFVTLTMLWTMLELLRGRLSAKKAWQTCIRNALLFVAGMLLYLLGEKLAFVLSGVSPNTSYIEMPELGEISVWHILRTLPTAWKIPLETYIKWLPGKVSRPYALIHGLVLIWAGLVTVYRLKKSGYGAPVWASVLGIAALLPLGMNCIYLIYEDQVHDLITCALFLPQIYAIVLAEDAAQEGLFPRKQPVQALALMLCVLFLCKGIWANQVYLNKGLEADSTRAILIRILDRVEQLDGYEPGVTPVHFVGYLYKSPLVEKRPAFHYRYRLTGSWSPVALTFGDNYWTFWSYFEDVLGYPIQPYTEPLTPAQEEAANEMPLFPAADSVQLVDGLVLIRFS